MEPLADTIELLKRVIQDKNCDRMNKSVVRGYLGELIVLQKLREEEYEPIHLGNQSAVDILVNNFKIDVKTSELKNDGFKIKNWGWALLRRGKEVEYDAAICVALNEQLDVAGYYCIYGKNISYFDSAHGRFTSVVDRFQKFQFQPEETSSKKLQDAYQKSEKLLEDGIVLEICPTGSLGDVFQIKE